MVHAANMTMWSVDVDVILTVLVRMHASARFRIELVPANPQLLLFFASKLVDGYGLDVCETVLFHELFDNFAKLRHVKHLSQQKNEYYILQQMGASVTYHKDVVVAPEFVAACTGTDSMLNAHKLNTATLEGLGVNAYTPPFTMEITSDPTLFARIIAKKYGSAVDVSVQTHSREDTAFRDDNDMSSTTYHNWVYVNARV